MKKIIGMVALAIAGLAVTGCEQDTDTLDEQGTDQMETAPGTIVTNPDPATDPMTTNDGVVDQPTRSTDATTDPTMLEPSDDMTDVPQ